MVVVAVIIGAVLGLAVFQTVSGFVVGATLGFLVAEIVALKSRVRTLERTVTRGAATESTLSSTTTAVATAPRSISPPLPPVTTEAPEPAPDPVPSRPPPAPAWVTASHEVESPPARPSLVDDAVRLVHGFFTEGNTVVRVGVVVLFFGIAFLLKYAAEHARLPIELRLAGVVVGAICLLFVGARLRHRREGYGLTLEGGAIGILCITIFAAFRLYGLLPASLAFALLLVTFGACVALALAQNSLALAAFGISGAFLAPVLASTGQGSHVALFSYYALVNTVVVVIAWFRAWRLLNLLGFVFTFVIGSLWGYRYYRPEFFGTTEPFLILFVIFYLAVAVLFARQQAPELRRPVDGTLVFGVPIVGFLLQAGLVKNYEYGLAWSAFALGAVYLALAWFVLTRGYSRLLTEAFLALGVIFATLTIPLAVDGHWTAAAWAIEGAGILWVGLRQSHVSAQIFGLLIQAGAGFFFFQETKSPSGIAVFNSAFIGCLLLSGAGLVSGYLLEQYRRQATTIRADILAYLYLAWGLLWWFGGTFNEIEHHVTRAYRVPAWLTLLAATTLAQHFANTRLNWLALRYATLCNLAWSLLALVWAWLTLTHPFANAGFIAWPFAVGAYYVALKHAERVAPTVATAAHTGIFWLLGIVLAWEAHWQVEQVLPYSDWPTAAVGIVLAALLLAPLALRSRVWPVVAQAQAYLVVGAVPVVALSLGWILIYGVLGAGNPSPLAYVPLLNPLDLAAMFVLLASFAWSYRSRMLTGLPLEVIAAASGAIVFLWFNAMMFRTLHHFADIPYTFKAMYGSTLAQSVISIAWTILAFVLMMIAKRLQLRHFWVIGAALLGTVVVKLFAVDLSGTGTVARIVSFVGVGVLLLIIGYLVPVPPRSAGREDVRA